MFLFLFATLSLCVAVPPSCPCNQSGVYCTSECSSTFCLCDEFGKGVIMNTVNGTVCQDGNQVWESDCGKQVANPSPTPERKTDCTCSHVGVNCMEECSSQYCLCGSTLSGYSLQVANNTVCYDDYLTWVDDTRCTKAPSHVCTKDGLYCTSPCSITYYYCSNGRQYPEQFVPYGTVCTEGGLVSPDQCGWNPSQPLISTCPTRDLSLQCYAECSPLFYYCTNYTAYVLQNAPSNLLCYNHAFVMPNQPMCYTTSVERQEFPITIQYKNDSLIWSALTAYAVASSMANELTTQGVPVTVNDVFLSESASIGRRLASIFYGSIGIQSTMNNLSAVLEVARNSINSKNEFMDIQLPQSTTPVTFTNTPSPIPAPLQTVSSANGTTLTRLILNLITLVCVLQIYP